ncbi:threonine aldolase family protein [Rhodospirillum sp. A1_3_36]|uniref:threonine aldolase family protein n=1 Tax=Rhodospirillum sp. A1_3_36 TaxID=3391666 RepID=UPI0039A44CC9
MSHAIAIDLVSDTATRPTQAMFAAMAAAATGDEQRGEDPTTRALCERVADYLGMEDALFLPSGTMCNMIAFLIHCRPGDEIIAAANAHVYGSEGAGAAALGGAQFRVIDSRNGLFDGAAVESLIRVPRHRSPRSRLLCLEQTANRGGGTVWPVDQITAVAEAARAAGLAVHMDGARLPNAAVASGRPARDHTASMDSAWIDFSKGLGCPVGAALGGSRAFIEEAWTWKHRLGGAMRQSGVLAAAALHAMDHHIDRLAEDHENARLLATELAQSPGISVYPRVPETNILFVELGDGAPSASVMAERLARHGVRLGTENSKLMRAVTHLDVSREQILDAVTAIRQVLKES